MPDAMILFSEPWLTRYQALVNADAEMRVVGDWFTVSLSLTSEGQRSIVRFERGQLAQCFPAPRVDVPCAFGFRATDQVWGKFLAPIPEPLYQTVFSMLMRVPGFVLEGDTLVAMQHARALHRATALMRLVGAA